MCTQGLTVFESALPWKLGIEPFTYGTDVLPEKCIVALNIISNLSMTLHLSTKASFIHTH